MPLRGGRNGRGSAAAPAAAATFGCTRPTLPQGAHGLMHDRNVEAQPAEEHAIWEVARAYLESWLDGDGE